MIPDILLVILLGLALGSFASAVTWRVPRGLSWIASGGRAEHSICPACQHRLSWLDLVPLFSWLFLRGRCRYCRAAIAWTYALIELATMAGCLAAYAAYGLSVEGIILMLAMPFMITLIAIDVEHMILPDQVNIILAGLGASFALFRHGLSMESVFSMLLAVLVYGLFALVLGWAMRKILKKEALGMGDVKFFAVAGVWLGLAPFPAFLILSGLCGIGVGVVFRIWKNQTLFPFGPALVLAMLACLLLLAEIQGFSGL